MDLGRIIDAAIIKQICRPVCLDEYYFGYIQAMMGINKKRCLELANTEQIEYINRTGK